MTDDLLRLLDWLTSAGCTHVAMESTGVYWKPVYNLLEGSLEVVVVNARHIKAVPGRKTDVKDCEWIAELLRHGLLQPSFIPDRPQRELRELTRYRTSLSRERAAEVNRLQKVLEGANIKLAAVATDIMGIWRARDPGGLGWRHERAGDARAASAWAIAREDAPAPTGACRPVSGPPALPGCTAAGAHRLLGRPHRAGERRDHGAHAPF
jgi:Transposase